MSAPLPRLASSTAPDDAGRTVATSQDRERGLFAVLGRRKWSAAIAFLFIAGPIVGYTYTTPRLYTSEAKLYVPAADSASPNDKPDVTTNDSDVYSLAELLGSREICERIVDTFGVDRLLVERENSPLQQAWRRVESYLPPPSPVAEQAAEREYAIRHVASRLQVAVPARSRIITVHYEADDAEFAQHVVANVIAAGKEIQAAVWRTAGKQAFFEEQAAAAERRREEAARLLRFLQDEAGAADLQARCGFQMQRLAEWEKESHAVAAELKRIDAERKASQVLLDAEPPTIPAPIDPSIPPDARRERLFALRLEEAELLAKFTQDSPLLLRVRDQLRAAELELAKNPPDKTADTIANPRRQELLRSQADRDVVSAGLRAKATTLAGQLEAGRRELQRLTQLETRFQEVERDRLAAEEEYRRHLAARDEARLSEEWTPRSGGGMNELQPPSRSVVPSSPHVPLHLASAGLLGLIAAITTAFYRDH